MRTKILGIILCLTMLLGCLAGCGGNAGVTNTTAVMTVFADTKAGGVMGYKYDNVNTFYGIPYATADRFEMPVAVAPWEKYIACLQHSEVCPQGATAMDKFDTFNHVQENVENENSFLALNVETPDMAPEKLKPVVVWLHGGGFSSGSAFQFDFYDGANLADSGDVVFVSVNHRLNCLGYLDLSAYGDQFKYSGNAGMADLVLALEWVRDNIATFGGDPNNVTIEGQSGGGGKVTTLMSMPAAQGLFDKAFAQSGGSVKIERTTESAQADTAKVVETLGLTGDNIGEQLQNLPYSELLSACKEAGVSYGPVFDGDYIPTGTFEMSKDIPLMCGNVMGEFQTNMAGLIIGPWADQTAWEKRTVDKVTEDEVKEWYVRKYGDNADAVMAAWKETYPEKPLAEGLYVNNRLYGFGANPLSKAMESYGGKAYEYLQAYSYPMFGGTVAVHTASDIPFWYNNLEMIPEFIAGDEVNAYKISAIMNKALINFMYTGDPSQDGLQWPAYTTANGSVMVFDKTTSVRNNFDAKFMELIK